MARTEQIEQAGAPGETSRFVVRPMTAADIPQAMDIERESFPTMWPQTAYARELKNRLARYFVLCEEGNRGVTAEESARPSPWRRAMGRFLRKEQEPEPTPELIIGVIGLWMMVDELHIVTIAVREAFRRQGAGEALLIAAIDFALANKMDAVTLEYRRSNEPARALYDKYGFLNVGVRTRYYSDNNEDAIVMTTPPLLSRGQHQLFLRLKEEHRRRWGGRYLLPDSL
ncbi:MAG: ribosomal protein S18-alanine N-acetyltransferase [Dehalococcoidia bacterium]|nr:ribosomal protein S18-alanine N-acetyltransferase [Dehalococcoidia bacterium]